MQPATRQADQCNDRHDQRHEHPVLTDATAALAIFTTVALALVGAVFVGAAWFIENAIRNCL